MAAMKTQAEIDAIAEQVRAAGIPDALNRWIGATPEEIEAAELRSRRTEREIAMPAKIGPKEQALRDLRNTKITETPGKPQRVKALRQMLDTTARTPQAVAPKPEAPAPAQPKEPVTMNTQTGIVGAPPANAKAPVEPKAPKPAKAPKKPAAKKTAKKAAKKTAKLAGKAKTKPAAAKAAKSEPSTAGKRPDGLREGSKQAVMIDMALDAKGATEAEMCAKLGWKKCRVTLGRVAEKIGAKLERREVDGESRWFATMPKKAK